MLGDPEELKVAVSNLIDNAIKYSGPEVHVAVELAPAQPKRLAVRVRDRGIGISAAELKRIFRRFYRIPGSRRRASKGTGLGLFIVRSVARKHGGRWSPRATARDTAARSRSRCRSRPTYEPHPDRRRRTAPRRRPAVQSRGREPLAEVVETGEAALARLTEEPAIDAVVLDVMLPGIDGFAVATELRKRGQFVPVLMLTARGAPQDVLRGFAAGADDYLPKPFDLDILIARVHGLLRRVGRVRSASRHGARGTNRRCPTSTRSRTARSTSTASRCTTATRACS